MRPLISGVAGHFVSLTGSVRIHDFSMVTQDASKRSVTKVYPAENFAHFNKKWNRSVRGNLIERRWTNFKNTGIRRYERFRYGHALIKKSNG